MALIIRLFMNRFSQTGFHSLMRFHSLHTQNRFLHKKFQINFLTGWIPNTLSVWHQDSLPLAALMHHQCPSQIKRKCLTLSHNKKSISVLPMWLKLNLCSWIITNGGWDYGSISQSVSAFHSSQTTAHCADVEALLVLSPRGAVPLTALFQMWWSVSVVLARKA